MNPLEETSPLGLRLYAPMLTNCITMFLLKTDMISKSVLCLRKRISYLGAVVFSVPPGLNWTAGARPFSKVPYLAATAKQLATAIPITIMFRTT